jgi:hypothetical protein
MEEINWDDLGRQYAFHVAQVRGLFLGEFILMERLMDTAISQYFCPDLNKQVELMEMIICTKRMTYESKIHVFRAILDKKNPDNKKDNSAIFKEMCQLGEIRNKIAHFMLDFSEHTLKLFSETNETFTLVKFDKTTIHEMYNREMVERYVKQIHKVTKRLIDDLPIINTAQPSLDSPEGNPS